MKTKLARSEIEHSGWPTIWWCFSRLFPRTHWEWISRSQSCIVRRDYLLTLALRSRWTTYCLCRTSPYWPCAQWLLVLGTLPSSPLPSCRNMYLPSPPCALQFFLPGSVFLFSSHKCLHCCFLKKWWSHGLQANLTYWSIVCNESL